MAAQKTAPAVPDLGCACANIRRAARLVTQLYGEEMAWGAEPAQFSLLSILERLPRANQASLGRLLGLDKTTLSRNLQLLEKRAWITRAPSKNDQRERGYHLTSAGRKILEKTKPGWLRAQAKLRAALEPVEWETMMKLLVRVAEATLEEQTKGKTSNESQ